MSLVGNFSFGNSDRTEEQAGFGNVRRPSQQYSDTDNPHQGMRRQSVQSHHKKSSEQETAPPLPRMDTEGIIYQTPAQTPGELSEKRDLSEKNMSDTDSEEVARREHEVHALARKMTSQSNISVGEKNPFNAEPGSALDPSSENFSARTWARAMLQLSERDPNTHPGRTAGIAFKNLNVHGFGNEADYQKSVGNVFYQVVGAVKKVFKMGQTRIDILRNFEGLVESGEMLVVLGPPGSGCSTFLKTIAGETHGFNVDEGSYLNYQGKPIAEDLPKVSS